MTQYLKIAIIYLLRVVLRVFHVFPVNKKRVVFISREGTQYSCNPKYLFEHMYKTYGDQFHYIWCLNHKTLLPTEYKNITTVKFASLGYVWYAMTSKYLISNLQIEPFFPVRKNQVVINTWHGGGAYKRTGALLPVYKARRQYMTILRDIRAKQTNYVISSCERFSVCMSEDWKIPEKKFLPTGMPRNDMLFLNRDCKEKISRYYNIGASGEKMGIILYAPTYRGNPRAPNDIDFTLNPDDILKAAETRFRKDFLFFYRGHFHFSFHNLPGQVYIVTGYPDMQELLCAADILITDYSSCMWDFSLTYKPCFIFAPDLDTYIDEQGFYTPVDQWPFPVARTNAECAENIMAFDPSEYRAAVTRHHRELGSFETGGAAELFCDIVFGKNSS